MPSNAALADVINLDAHPIDDLEFQRQCRTTFDSNGIVALNGFVRPEACRDLITEANDHRALAFFSEQDHNVYLDAPDPSFPQSDARSHPIVSTKGAVTTDQIPDGSHLRTIYDSPTFRSFLCAILGEQELYEYADPLSSINLNFYEEGQELGWHFDNSEFSVTLLVQEPEAGGDFEYINHLRDTAAHDNNEIEVGTVLDTDGRGPTHWAAPLVAAPGTLVLFRGRDALHRVTPVIGEQTRVLVVFAYNTEPGLSLSESARLTFFGRLD